VWRRRRDRDGGWERDGLLVPLEWVGGSHSRPCAAFRGLPPTASLTDSDQMKHHAAGDRKGPFLHGFGSRSRLRMF
jgi:hypothetical protein